MAGSLTMIQHVYTDGACSGNPGPGGWGTLIQFDDGAVHEMGGASSQTTNNRMEMQAAIAALEFILASGQTDPVELYTDSEYVKNGITKWLSGWKRKQWKTSAGKPVLNQDLWQVLDRLNSQVNDQLNTPLSWRYVRGHSGNVGNDRCDAIARAFASGQVPVLKTAVPVSRVSDRSSPDSAADRPTSADFDPSFDTSETNINRPETIESELNPSQSTNSKPAMVDTLPSHPGEDSELPREVRVSQLRNLVETLHMADEIASKGYLITSSELADLMDINASAVTSRGDNWVWRNWVVSRVRREGNQILWQLERVD
ncbi:MAG: ribonuclease HI [Elainellaceae cyanobacterium]